MELEVEVEVQMTEVRMTEVRMTEVRVRCVAPPHRGGGHREHRVERPASICSSTGIGVVEPADFLEDAQPHGRLEKSPDVSGAQLSGHPLKALATGKLSHRIIRGREFHRLSGVPS